jgi:hypothetical protein
LNESSCLSACPGSKVGRISTRKCEFSCDSSYFSDAGTCSACDVSCESCSGSSATECLSCFQGEFLNADGSCQSSCSEDAYYEDVYLR